MQSTEQSESEKLWQKEADRSGRHSFFESSAQDAHPVYFGKGCISAIVVIILNKIVIESMGRMKYDRIL